MTHSSNPSDIIKGADRAAERAYTAYRAHLGDGSLFAALPEWSGLEERFREPWREVAKAIIDEEKALR